MCFLPRIGTSVFVVPLVNKTIGRLFVELLHEPGQALPARPSIHPLPSCTVDVPLSGSCRRQSCPHAAPAHVSIRFPSTGIHIRPTGLPSVPFRVPRDGPSVSDITDIQPGEGRGIFMDWIPGTDGPTRVGWNPPKTRKGSSKLVQQNHTMETICEEISPSFHVQSSPGGKIGPCVG